MPPFGSLQGRMGGRATPKRVEYVADAIGSGTTTTNQRITLPAHWDGDLILVSCGSLTSTVPSLPTGCTNVHTVVNTGATTVRSHRIFYFISDGTPTILDVTTSTTVGLKQSACMIFRNAVSVGAFTRYTDTLVNALTQPFSSITLQNDDGTSIVVGATWYPTISSVVAGGTPMTMGTTSGTSPVGAMMVRTDNVTSFVTTSFNSNASYARLTSTIEVRGPVLTKVWSALDGSKTLVSDNNVSSWGGPVAFPQATAANQPVYDPMTDLVSFTRTSAHFLNAGAQTLNIATNGGFTAIFYFKYTGTGGTGERIFDFGSGAPNNNVLVHRLDATTNTFAFYITNGATVVNNLSTAANVLVQNQFAVWAVRYRAYDLSATIFKNDISVASGTASALVTDRTVTMSHVGRPVTGWASPIDLNGSICGLYVYDRALADEEITNLSIHKFGANFGAVRGFSLQRLFTTYAGPVVRVRRSSDSLEQAFWADTLSGTLLSSALSKRFTDLDAASRIVDTTGDGDNLDMTSAASVGGRQYQLLGHFVDAIDVLSMVLGANNAFNKTTVNVNDCWHSAIGLVANGFKWISFQYPTSKLLVSYTIVARTGDAVNIWSPRIWAFQGSNDGSIWTTLDSQSGITFTVGQSRTYPVPSVNAYQYYRLYVTNAAQNGSTGGGDYVAIGELIITTKNSGTDVTSWGSPIAFVGSGTTAPAYISADDVVRFTRANSDYLNAGAQTLAISTNGGFTAVVMARFTGTAGNYERILDFNSGTTSDYVVFCRYTTTNNLFLEIRNGASSVVCSLQATGAIVQGELAIFVARYRKSDNSAQIYKNNELVADVTGLAAITDKTFTASYIGRPFDASAYFNGDIRGLYVYNYALTDSEIQSVILSKFGMAGVSGPEYDAFVGTGTGYISQLFDQTGQGYHATQVTTASQPWIVKETSWTSSPTIRCGGVGWLGYNGATNAIVNTNYTVAVTTARTSTATSNYFLGGTSATTNQNLHLGYRTNTSFTHDQNANGYDMTIPAYSVPTSETFVVRHSSTLAKNTYKNGTLLGSGASAVALGAYAGAQIGRYQTATPYYGDVSSLIMFGSYISNQRRQIVEADLAGLLGSPATYAPLDIISTGAKATCVAAYSLRQATATYTGAIVRLRRPSDSVESDFTAADFNSGAVATWAGATTPTVTTLYDQSGGGNHLTQSTVANQPSLLVSDRAVRFDQTTVSKTLRRTWNVFGASTLTQMHMVSATRENVRGVNDFFTFTKTGGGVRFGLLSPHSDGTWYWDVGNDTAATGRASGGTSVVGATTVFSGYKNPSNGLTGYRLNGGTTYTSTGGTSTMTVTGVTLGGSAVGASQDVFEFMIFNAKLPVTDEISLEIDLQRF